MYSLFDVGCTENFVIIENTGMYYAVVVLPPNCAFIRLGDIYVTTVLVFFLHFVLQEIHAGNGFCHCCVLFKWYLNMCLLFNKIF